MYIKNPKEIEVKSFDIIEEVMDDTSFTENEKLIVKRMIHTTGDLEYRKIVCIENDFISKAESYIKAGNIIYTDTKMVYSGINKKNLRKFNSEAKFFIDDEDIFKKAKETGLTRSSLCIDKAINQGIKGFVIGNAPTALFRLMEFMEEGFNPEFIIGVPVGFVGAAESKEALRDKKFIVPKITTIGNKGGSNVAASIVNALLYMNGDR